MVPLMYLSTHLAAWRWQSAGEYINYDSLLTVNVMSEQVKVMYWGAPMILRWALIWHPLLIRLSLVCLLKSWVQWGFYMVCSQSIPNLWSMYLAYLDRVTDMHVVVLVTSRPKKNLSGPKLVISNIFLNWVINSSM